MRIFLCVLLMAPNMASSFTFGNPFQSTMSARPDLLDVIDEQKDMKLNIQLRIGQEEGPQMAVTDMIVELHHEAAEYDHVSLPGADGPHNQLSSGHRRLDLLAEGKYVSIMGTQHVKTNRGCWEMCWRKDRPAGTLICGFEIPQECKRNDATLPKGFIYLSFPLWTDEGIKYGQEEKRKIELNLEKCTAERDEALENFDLTQNPLMKALHLRNAFAAAEKYYDTDHQTLASIPTDHAIIRLQDDLLLTTKGVIWAKEGLLAHRSHTLLGYAMISPETKRKSRLMP